jgi:Amt family ammonium transporter
MTNPHARDGKSADTAYKHLFDNSPNAVVFCDLDGIIRFTNAAFERLFGFAAAEITGHPLEKVLRPIPGAFDEPKEWLPSPAVEYFPTKRLRADQTLVDVAVSFFPLTADQNLQGTFIIYQCLTRVKETEARALRTEKKYRSIFHNAVEGIFLTTPYGRYLDVNPALAAIYGFSSRH